MSPTSQLFSAIAWTLIHSLWQGALAALSYRVARAVPVSAGTRYAVGHLSIAAFILLQAATFAYANSHLNTLGEIVAAVSTDPQPLTSHGQTELRLPPSAIVADLIVSIQPMLPWLAAVWLAGLAAQVAWMSVILTAMELEIRRCVEIADPYRSRLHNIGRKLRGTHAVRFLECAAVTVPGTLGWLRPVVLVPTGWLLSTPARDVEAIILHELAHIARRDFLGGIVRHFVGAIYYFNLPLRWQIKALAGDAEQATDAMAAEAFGDVRRYSEALLQLEVGRSSIALVLGADGGTLSERVRYLSSLRAGLPRRIGRIVVIAFVSALTTLSVCYGTIVAAVDREDVAWLERHTLPSGVVELLSTDRANPQAEMLLAGIHQAAAAGKPLKAADLMQLALSLRSGLDSGQLVREADAVDLGRRFEKEPLPTFGTRKSRALVVTSLRQLAEQESGERASCAARAALMMAAIDLCYDGGSSASELIRTNEFRDTLGLSAAKSRQLEMLLAVHTRRLNQVLNLVYSVPDSDTLTDESLGKVVAMLAELPGAWRVVIKVPNPGVRKQIAAAIGRGESDFTQR